MITKIKIIIFLTTISVILSSVLCDFFTKNKKNNATAISKININNFIKLKNLQFFESPQKMSTINN